MHLHARANNLILGRCSRKIIPRIRKHFPALRSKGKKKKKKRAVRLKQEKLEERKPSHMREIEHQQKHINPFSFALMIHLLHYKKIAQTLMKSTNFNFIYIYISFHTDSHNIPIKLLKFLEF